MIKKLYALFEGMDVVCVCEPHVRECRDKECKEYVVRFIEIDRSENFAEAESGPRYFLQDAYDKTYKLVKKMTKKN